MFPTKEVEYITQAIENGLTGEFNQRLETEFAKKFDTKYAIGVNSGTSALHSALYGMGIQERDEVIVPALTFASTGLAPIYLGATPIFTDIDPDTFNISIADAERKITKKTKAIIPVSLYGLPADLEGIVKFAEAYSLRVLEDNAQCFLGQINGKLAGTFGNASIFSFERTKPITAGGGGMVITNDSIIAEKTRKFSILGYSTLTAGTYQAKPKKEVLQDPEFERHVIIAPNYRMPEIVSAMLLAQLEKLEDLVNIRIKVANAYQETIKNHNWLRPQKTPEGYINSYFTFAMALDTKKVPWKEFQKKFVKQGGDPFYAAWKLTYQEPAIRDKFKNTYCPIAEELQPRIIQLKTNFGTEEKIEEQTEALRRTIEYFEN